MGEKVCGGKRCQERGVLGEKEMYEGKRYVGKRVARKRGMWLERGV